MDAPAPEPVVVPRKPPRGATFDVYVEGLDPRGRGLARLDLVIGPQRLARRYQVELPRAVPGDHVRISVRKVRRRVIEAVVESVLRPSSDRVAPRCPHAGVPMSGKPACGGCTLQPLPYPVQLAAKERLVRGHLEGAGLDPEVVASILGCASPWYYRNKLELTFGPAAGGGLGLGFYPIGYRFEVIRLEDCLLESAEAVVLIEHVRAWAEAAGLEPWRPRHGVGWLRTLTVREGKRTGQRMVELSTNPHDVVETSAGPRAAAEVVAELAGVVDASGVPVTSLHWSQVRAVRGEPTTIETTHLAGAPVLEEELRVEGAPPLRFEVHPRAFFQPNTLQAEVLYGEVGRLAGDHPGTVLDLYCGTGTIGMTLAHRAREVTGIELSAEAVANARDNVARNGLTNLTHHVGDVGKVLKRLELRPDLVVVDPPRAGLQGKALDHLVATGAPRIVYVSCNPATLASNAAALVEAGWALESVQPVDMFPQTMHVENVALLTRAG